MNLLQLDINAVEAYRPALKQIDDPMITDDTINSNHIVLHNSNI